MTSGFAAPVTKQVETSSGKLQTMMTTLVSAVTGWHNDFKKEAGNDRKDIRAIIRNLETTDKTVSSVFEKVNDVVGKLSRLADSGEEAFAAQKEAAKAVSQFFEQQAAVVAQVQAVTAGLPTAPTAGLPTAPTAGLPTAPTAHPGGPPPTNRSPLFDLSPVDSRLPQQLLASEAACSTSGQSSAIGGFLQNLRGCSLVMCSVLCDK